MEQISGEPLRFFGSIELTPEREREIDRVARLGFSSEEETLVSNKPQFVAMSYGRDDRWHVLVTFPHGRVLRFVVPPDAVTTSERGVAIR
jgi:hypothetical protein